MLNTKNKIPLPMIDGDSDSVYLFGTEKEAEEQASVNPYGMTYGYEVYEWNWD
jgi:hypothetical protein